MTRPRTQGRPRINEHLIGRERLLEKTRVAMSRSPRTELQRRDIAEIAGVSPALINYYFPDKWQMLEEASLPIIEFYISQVTELLDRDENLDFKLKKLVSLYIVFNKENGHLLEYYIEATSRLNKTEGIRLLQNVHMKIISFIKEFASDRNFNHAAPEFINSLLWGLCKYISQIPEEKNESYLSADTLSVHNVDRSDLVFKLFFNGLRP